MRYLLVLLAAVQISLLTAHAGPAKECSVCVGVARDASHVPPVPVPLLLELHEEGLEATGTPLDAFSTAQKAKTVVVVDFQSGAGDSIGAVEQKTASTVAWITAHGPFLAAGIHLTGADATLSAFAVKRLSTQLQGLNLAAMTVASVASENEVSALFGGGASPYVDAVLVPDSQVPSISKWLLEHDPAKKIFATVAGTSSNPLFDLAQPLSQGATRAFLRGPADDGLDTALAAADTELAGDYAFDSTSRVSVLDARGAAAGMPVLSFVRGEDLRTLLVPRGDAAASVILSLPAGSYVKPRRVDAQGARQISDVGIKGDQLLIGVAPAPQTYLVAVDHAEATAASVTKENIEIATHRGITVEEIIRNHQSYRSYQESIQRRYVAYDSTKLRFTLTAGESLEATIAGDYFAQPGGVSDWVWQNFYIDGVKWKYGNIPELPLVQPEKVTQLPLDIHLTNEYRYQLVRETNVAGYHVYEVRFDPPANPSKNLPLYRGTVWIDARTWARIRISMIQINLTGEVLSSEENVDFLPFKRGTSEALSSAQAAGSDPRELLWLPSNVSAEQVISAAGHGTVILRSTEFSNFRIDPPEFDALHASDMSSNYRIIRESESAGMKYMVKQKDGERKVKEGFDTSRKFLVGGIHHDSGLQYPVLPLGGIDYFNFNFRKTGIQTNVFFAGAVLVANVTNPDLAHTRTNAGVDIFAIAVPTTSSIFRNGTQVKSEEVRDLPTRVAFRVGHPFLGFGKADFTLDLTHNSYSRSSNTASTFILPESTFELSPGVDAQYARWGSTLTGFFSHTTRTKWRPWGDLAEYNPDQKSYSQYGASFAKSFYLPKFQRLGFDVDYLTGSHLDRFSQYQVGFFGAQHIHGVESGSIRGDRMILAHVSYGFVFSDQFRLETFYDQGLINNKFENYRNRAIQGIGVGGQTIGPWGTLLRLDLGKTVGANSQSGFVADVVFLKLF